MAGPLIPPPPDFQPSGVAQGPTSPPDQGQGMPQAPSAPQGPLAASTRARALADRLQAGRAPSPFGLPSMPVASPSLAVGGAGGGLLGLAGRAGVQGAVSGLENLMGTRDPGKAITAGVTGAVTQPLGEGVAKAGGYLLSAIPYKKQAAQTAEALVDYLKKKVPAWAGYGTGTKALYEMAHGEGANALDGMFKQAKALIPEGTLATVPAEVAKVAGIKTMRTPLLGKGDEDLVQVPTAELVEKLAILRGARTKNLGNLHGQAWRAIDASLAGVPNQALQQARAAYKVGMGWTEFAQKGKFVDPDRFDLVKAQAAFKDAGQKMLLRRSMQPVRQVILPPGQTPIRQQTPSMLPWHIGLGGAGLLGAHGLGLPIGGAPGLLAALAPRPSFYTGVARGPVARGIQGALPGGLTAATNQLINPQTPPAP